MATSAEELESKAAAFARKGALWLLATAFVLILSASIISQAFVQKFFEPQLYLDSLESHGLYPGMQKGMVEIFSSRMPAELKDNVTATVASAVTYDYVKGQSTRLITNFLDYFSSKKQELDLTLDLVPIKSAFDSSPDGTMRLLGPEMPSSMDFAAQLRQSGQLGRLSEFRSQISGAAAANALAFALSALLLVPVFLLHSDWREGLSKCLELIFNAGVSSLIGGAVFAFLSPIGLPMLLGVSSPNQGVANIISAVMGDVLREIGMLIIIYSLPLVAIGFIAPRLLGLKGAKPVPVAASSPAQAQPPSAPPAPADAAPPRQSAQPANAGKQGGTDFFKPSG